MLSLGRVCEGDFSADDMRRARYLVTNKAETMIALYRADNVGMAHRRLQSAAACTCLSAVVPCVLPCAYLLPWESRKATKSTLYVVTDRTLYQLVDKLALQQMPCTRLVQTACPRYVSRRLIPTTGPSGGSVPLVRVGAIGTNLQRLTRIGHQGEAGAGAGGDFPAQSEDCGWCCCCCPTHYVAVAVAEPDSVNAPDAASAAARTKRVAPADGPLPFGQASLFLIFMESAEAAAAAEKLLRTAAEAARSNAPLLSEVSGIPQRKERVRSLSMERDAESFAASVTQAAAGDGATRGSADVRGAGADRAAPRRRSVSFEQLGTDEQLAGDAKPRDASPHAATVASAPAPATVACLPPPHGAPEEIFSETTTLTRLSKAPAKASTWSV